MSKVKTDIQFSETTLYGSSGDAYRPFQGLQVTSETSDSAAYGIAELFSTYIDQSVPEWVAGGFIQAKTTNKDDTNLTLGTTGLAFEFFGGGLSDTVGSLSSTAPTNDMTQTGLFPLAWVSAIHEGLQATWNPDYFDPYLEFAAKVIGRRATATATLSNGAVGSISVSNPGSGYTSAPRVDISGGGVNGTTAIATATLSNGAVGSISVSNPGSGYTSAPDVDLIGGGGAGATATATLSGGTVGSITIDCPGSGYASAPDVKISGGGVNGATAIATATLSNGAVGSISVSNPGSGYTSAPTVTISGGGGDALGVLEEALSGKVFQKVREGNSFSWADGYSMVQYKEGFQRVTVGNLDSLQVLDMEQFQSQRQKIAEGLRGGKWPQINVQACSDIEVTNQQNPSPIFEVEIPSGFTTTNGPDEYNPELNFSFRRFGSKWSAATGNQVVFGTGSGDFNLGPVLNFSYYSKDAQEWSIDITDDMVEKLFSDWDHEFEVNTNASTSAPEYASDFYARDLEHMNYPTPENIDSTQLFDEVPEGEWWKTRNKLVKTGLNESYEICASGDVMFSWEKGNRRDVLIEDKEGQKRSANYDDGKGNYTYSQRDLTETESTIEGVLHETQNITDSLSTTIKTGFNLSTDLTWLMGLSTDEVGFTMGGPLKPYDATNDEWKAAAYFNTDKWKGQGATGSLTLQPYSWEINALASATEMQITNPTNMRITSDFTGEGFKADFEITGSVTATTIALLGDSLVKPTGLFGKTWAKGQAGELSFADVRTFLARSNANAAPTAETEGAGLNSSTLQTTAGNINGVAAASSSNPLIEVHT